MGDKFKLSGQAMEMQHLHFLIRMCQDTAGRWQSRNWALKRGGGRSSLTSCQALAADAQRCFRGDGEEPKHSSRAVSPVNIITQSQGLQRLSSLVFVCMGNPTAFVVGWQSRGLLLPAGSQNDAHTLILPPGYVSPTILLGSSIL